MRITPVYQVQLAVFEGFSKLDTNVALLIYIAPTIAPSTAPLIVTPVCSSRPAAAATVKQQVRGSPWPGRVHLGWTNHRSPRQGLDISGQV